MQGIMIGVAVVLLCAFLYGFKMGAKQVGWKGLSGFVALLLYVLAATFLSKTVAMPTIGGIDGAVAVNLLFALASIVIVLIVYGILTKLFRPAYVWVTKNPVFRSGPYEYEDDSAEYDTGEVQRRLVWKNAGIPTIYGRFMGAIVCMLNVAAVLALILSVAVTALKASSFGQTEAVVAILEDATLKPVADYIAAYGMDFVLISIIFAVACAGYKYGFFKSMFLFFDSLGKFVAIGVAVAVPFLLGQSPAIASVINMVKEPILQMTATNEMLKNIITEQVATIVGQTAFAIVLFVVLLIVVKVLKEIFRSLAKTVKRNEQTLGNGILGCVLYILLGIAVCVGICALLGFLLPTSTWDFLGENSLSKILIELTSSFIVKA